MCVKTILYLNLIYHITLLSTSYIHTYIYIYHIYMYHITFFLIGGQLLYNIVVYFAIHWHESAMGVHVSPILNPTPTSLPPSGLSQCTSFECPVSYIELGLVIYFTYGNIHVSMLFSQIIPLSPSTTESKSVLYICVSFAVSHIGSLLTSF